MANQSAASRDWMVFRPKLTEPGEPAPTLNELEDPHNDILACPPPVPPWRHYNGEVLLERLVYDKPAAEDDTRGTTFVPETELIEMVNAAIYLRRPMLITGKPGTGKSSLIYAVARQLRLGKVLKWPITSRSTLKDGLYEYDAIGRLQQKAGEDGATDIAAFLKLGPLGTALLPTERPWALLIDEIDKSDIDLPNDLLNVFEEGEFRIPELERMTKGTVYIRDVNGDASYPIQKGHVECRAFPFVVMTSNGEREFPAPFLRRCLRYMMPDPDEKKLAIIVENHLGGEARSKAGALISAFAADALGKSVATDQLLNAVFMVARAGPGFTAEQQQRVLTALQQSLTPGTGTP
jgi:MoxR-like ATPase